jgi:hypothetical protein
VVINLQVTAVQLLHLFFILVVLVSPGSTALHSHTLELMVLPFLVRVRELLLLVQTMHLKHLLVLQLRLLVRQSLLHLMMFHSTLKLLVTHLLDLDGHHLSQELVYQKQSSMLQTLP